MGSGPSPDKHIAAYRELWLRVKVKKAAEQTGSSQADLRASTTWDAETDTVIVCSPIEDKQQVRYA